MKGVPLLPKMVYKKEGVGPQGRAYPYKTLLRTSPQVHSSILFYKLIKQLILRALCHSFLNTECLTDSVMCLNPAEWTPIQDGHLIIRDGLLFPWVKKPLHLLQMQSA